MKIKRLRVQNFRNHIDMSCEFSDAPLLIYGMNGTGKTSLLEALYLAYRGVSFKGTDKDITNYEAPWYRVDIEDDDFKRTVTSSTDQSGHTRRFIVDDKKFARLPIKYKYPIVLFSPDDLQLLTGSPTRRRTFMDVLISQYDPHYAVTLRRYERALLQRNKLLKRPGTTNDLLFPWNVQLSENGSYILLARRDLIERINATLTDQYQRIAQNSDEVQVAYTHPARTAQHLLHEYEASLARDFALGSTVVGPHRHDMQVTLRSHKAADVASRGENRTIVLALKAIEADILSDKTDGLEPLILLDDVYGELDEARQNHLVDVFRDRQIIITSTHSIAMPGIDALLLK